MIGTRSLQWGAVVMTTLDIQKAVVVTTKNVRVHGVGAHVPIQVKWLMTSQQERTHGSAMML
jgi:hypothetical protein